MRSLARSAAFCAVVAFDVSAIVGGTFGLWGCATHPAQAPAPAARVICLPLKAYSPAQQRQAAAELSKLPSDSVVAGMMVDYLKLRDADRACQSAWLPTVR